MGRPPDCRIVLVRPRNPLNIGAVARAMANFGFRDLVVVDPFAPAWREARSAVGAVAVLEAARAVPALPQALDDRTFVVGTTTGRRRSQVMALRSGRADLVLLPELAERIAGEKAALLFGPENTGLSNEHFAFCHLLARIPTDAACPSMNLAQAVALCCFELSRAKAPAARAATRSIRSGSARAPAEQVEQLRAEMEEMLCAVGYLPFPVRRSDTPKLRRFLLRLSLNSRDLDTLRGMLAKVRWKLEQLSGRRS